MDKMIENVNSSFIDFLFLLINYYPFFQGMVFGNFGWLLLSLSNEDNKLTSQLLGLFTLCGGILPIVWGVLTFKFDQDANIPFYWWALGAISAVAGMIFIERQGYLEKIRHSFSKSSDLEREKKTDVRDISKILPKEIGQFDPEIYYKKGSTFIGLSEKRKPIYWDGDLPHIQACGTTGSGKGVFMGSLSAQCALNGEAVIVIDPKDDEWFPHVARTAAVKAGVPYYFINLRTNEYQFNLFQDANNAEAYELLAAGFDLGDRGEAADFYKIADRKMARFVADNMQPGDTVESFYREHAKYLAKAEGFEGKFSELARMKAINAVQGPSLKDVIENGGVIYVIGSTRQPEIIRVQKMLFLRLVQIAEARDRIDGENRKVCVILDEMKYHISKGALEGLGAARDKGMHIVLAHQSMDDFESCPADMTPKEVKGAVFDNCALRLVYRVRSPETAEYFAEMTGKILVDDESRSVDKGLSLTDQVSSERTIRQAERPLIDQNMFLNLPKRCGVVFTDDLAQFAYTSPYNAEKSRASIEVKASKGDEGESLEPDFNSL